MNTITKLLAFALAVTTAAAAHAQVTGTSLPNKLTLTSGNYTTTGTFVYTDAIGVGVAKVTVPNLIDFGGWGPLDTGVLTGLSLTGGLLSTTARISGLLTNTGGIVGTTAAFTGTGTFGQLFTTGVSANRVVYGGSGGRLIDSSFFTYDGSNLSITGGLISTSATINGPLTVTGATTFTGGVQTRGYQEFFGRVDIRNAQTTKLSIGTAGTQYFSVVDTNTASYLSLASGYGIGFSKDTGSTTVGMLTQTDGVLKITNASTGIGVLQTGGFASNFRALAASGNLTTTDAVVTLTGAITLSLPSTSITGQQFILKNIGGVTGTATVVGGTKTIDGATTQAIISGAGAASSLKFIYDGTNYIIGQ